MGVRNVVSVLRETWQEFTGDNADRLAAALAYYVIFSLAPLLVVITVIAGSVYDRSAVRHAIFDQARVLVGPDGAKAMYDMMEHANTDHGGTIATVLGVIAMILGAAGVFQQLQSSLNAVWGVRTKPMPFVRGFLRTRLFSIAMLLGAGFLLLVSLVINAGIAAVTNRLADRLPGSMALWQTGYWILSIAAAAAVIGLVFKFVPDVKIRLRDVLLGATITAGLFALGQVLLGYYLGRSAFSSTFGAAGSFVVVLVWVYYSSQVLLFGAELTQVLARRAGVPVVPSAHAEFADCHDASGLPASGAATDRSSYATARAAPPRPSSAR